MCGEQIIKGIVDPIFFRSELRFFGEIWSNRVSKTALLMKFLSEGDWKQAGIELGKLWQQGLEFLKELDGPFILVYFDRRQRKGFFYRSLLCKSPLYYRKRGRQWLWSMEIPDLLEADRSVLAQVAPERVLLSYLKGGLPETASFYQGVYRLPAGGLARYEDEQIHVQTFALPLVRSSLAKWSAEDLMSLLHDTMVRPLVWNQGDKVGVMLSEERRGFQTISLFAPFASQLVAYLLKEEGSVAEIALAEKIAHWQQVACVVLGWDEEVRASATSATWLPSFYLTMPSLSYWREHCVRDRVTRCCYDAASPLKGLERRKRAFRWPGLPPALTLFSKEANNRLMARKKELAAEDARLWPVQCWLNEEDALFYTPFWLEKGLRFFYPALSREWLEMMVSDPQKLLTSIQLLKRWLSPSSANLSSLAPFPVAKEGLIWPNHPCAREWTGREWLKQYPQLVEWNWIDPDRFLKWWGDGRKQWQLRAELLWLTPIAEWLKGLESLTVQPERDG